MIETRGELDLTQKALGAEGSGEVGVKNLESDDPVVPPILGEEHGCHSAAPELAINGVATVERSAQTLDWKSRSRQVGRDGDAPKLGSVAQSSTVARPRGVWQTHKLAITATRSLVQPQCPGRVSNPRHKDQKSNQGQLAR